MPIPAHAKAVFRGEIFTVYQWQQEMFDGTTATFEMAKRPDTVVVLPLLQGNVAYSRQEQPGKPPFLGLFGGRMEEGEEPLAAAQRELLEESGLTSSVWEPLFTHSLKGKLEWNIHYFIARNCVASAAQSLDAGEKVEVLTCTPEEFLATIVPNPAFAEQELRNRLYSSPNPTAMNELKAKLS